jgi:DNA ligase 1
MKYQDLVRVYEKLESTTKRLEKTDIIAEFLKKTSDEDLGSVIYLMLGRVFPQWDERKIGFSSRLLIKSIDAATGSGVKKIEDDMNNLGDLGDVSEKLIKTKSQRTLFSECLSVEKVINNLRKLAELEGAGTVNRKVGLVAELLSNASPEESRFICRTVLEVLRIGIAEGIIRDAIAKTFERGVKEVEEAFDLLVDYGEVAKLAKADKLKGVKIKPGRPLKLMLAVLVKGVEDGFERVGMPAALEFKYDGFRMQVHFDGKELRLYTRSMEDVTKQFPDIVENVRKNVKGDNFILDCEAVGYSSKDGKYLPFQKISQRIRRKYETEDMAKKFPVELNVFDLIYYEGKKLTDKRFDERRKLLEKIVDEKSRRVVLSKLLVTDNVKKVEKFFQDSLKAGHEGLMFKSLDAKYKPGRYVGYMAKLKDVMDALDLVIIKAERGEGKRASWLTSYTVACDNDGEFLEVGKVSTGLKEVAEDDDVESFHYMTEELKKLKLSEKGKEISVKPKVVVEVSYEEIQQSPTYNSGYALRFPRIQRVRNDKSINEISTIDIIKKLYLSQNK